MANDSVAITNFKEGKKHAKTLSRSIMFKTNANGIKLILDKLDGGIQVNQQARCKNGRSGELYVGHLHAQKPPAHNIDFPMLKIKHALMGTQNKLCK